MKDEQTTKPMPRASAARVPKAIDSGVKLLKAQEANAGHWEVNLASTTESGGWTALACLRCWKRMFPLRIPHWPAAWNGCEAGSQRARTPRPCTRWCSLASAIREKEPELLGAIDELNSISTAARRLGFTYRLAWELIRQEPACALRSNTSVGHRSANSLSPQ